MYSRKNIKLLLTKVRNFALNIISLFVNIISICIFTRNIKIKHRCETKKKEIAILGNGPSLAIDYINYLKNSTFLKNKDLMVVNAFACSTLYDIIKPNYYIFFDFVYFDDDLLDKSINYEKNDIIRNICDRTSWTMIVLVPVYASTSKFVQNILQNKNVSVSVFNNVPLFSTFGNLNFYFFNRNLGNVSFRNILICAIFQALNLKYTRIYLFGADHSWHENLRITEENELLRKETHFYEYKNDYRKHVRNYSNEIHKLHEELYNISKVLAEYYTLKEYSLFKNANIFNLSSKSWIDAFPRSIS